MIYAIGDLHFDHTGMKPMDVFGQNWVDHENTIINNWKEIVTDVDLVILPGDISWALKLEEAKGDLERIDELPGQKVILKGNHDYWWSSISKLNSLGYDSIHFLQNNSIDYQSYSVAGTRGWISRDSEDFNEDDEKIFQRELLRLRMSLEGIKDTQKIIAIVHYPPFNMDLSPNEFIHIMKEFNVSICVYGHLHSEGHKYAVEGNIDGIEIHCVSSDFINFKPRLIARSEKIEANSKEEL